MEISQIQSGSWQKFENAIKKKKFQMLTSFMDHLAQVKKLSIALRGSDFIIKNN